MMDDVARYDDKNTGDICVLKVREVLSVPAMDINCVPPHVMREVGVNMKTEPKFKQKISPVIKDNSVCFLRRI